MRERNIKTESEKERVGQKLTIERETETVQHIER